MILNGGRDAGVCVRSCELEAWARLPYEHRRAVRFAILRREFCGQGKPGGFRVGWLSPLQLTLARFARSSHANFWVYNILHDLQRPLPRPNSAV